MHQQRRLSVQHDHRVFGQKLRAGAAREIAGDQEIAVAMLEIHRHAAVAERAEFRSDEGAGVGRIVIADPGFEQVAEDVQRVGAAGLAVNEFAE